MKNAFSTFVFGSYERFIPYYIVSIKRNYSDADIVLFYAGTLSKNIRNFINTYKDNSIIIYENFYTNYFGMVENFKLRGGGSKTLLRFLIPGDFFKQYSNIYFGDVDILILKEKENLFNFHLLQANYHNVPFSNKVRRLPDSKNLSKRLSGLHFVKTKEYFSAMDPIISNFFDSKKFRENLLKNVIRDEEFLYKINKIAFEFDSFEIAKNKRPWHGFHLGLVRDTDYLNLKTIQENSSITIDDLKQQLLDLNSKGFIDEMLLKYTCREVYLTYKYFNLNLSNKVSLKYEILEYKKRFKKRLRRIKHKFWYG